MPNRFLKTSFAIWFVLQLSACAVAPPDVPVCTELAINRGFCVNSISNKEFEINDEQLYSPNGDTAYRMSWWEMRPYMIMLPYQSWVEIKKFIVKVCKNKNVCSGAVSNWERAVNTMDAKLENKLP